MVLATYCGMHTNLMEFLFPISQRKTNIQRKRKGEKQQRKRQRMKEEEAKKMSREYFCVCLVGHFVAVYICVRSLQCLWIRYAARRLQLLLKSIFSLKYTECQQQYIQLQRYAYIFCRNATNAAREPNRESYSIIAGIGIGEITAEHQPE